MEEKKRTPHILIQGRPRLTGRLWNRVRGPKPLVLTMNISAPPWASLLPGGYEDRDGDPVFHRLFGISLIHELEGTPDWQGGGARFASLLQLARLRFREEEGPLRVVCVGDHESLWRQELFGRDLVVGIGAQERVAELRAHREYALKLYRALEVASAGYELEFVPLHEALSALRPSADGGGRFHEVANDARARLAQEFADDDMVRAIPLLYTRAAPGARWLPFQGSEGRAPYKTMYKLISQYSGSEERRAGHECVLTKLLPRLENIAERLNPCDLPITTTRQLGFASGAGIGTVLLDEDYGCHDRDYDIGAGPAAEQYSC